MVRTAIVLPPDSTGQAMGVVTYTNDAGDTVAAAETVLVDPATGRIVAPETGQVALLQALLEEQQITNELLRQLIS